MPLRPPSGPAGAPTYTRRVIETATGGFLSVGQPTARRIALRSAANGPGASTLLIHGPRGAGKETFVNDLLALAFCTDPDPDMRPCNACRGCRDARARVHPDLVIGSPRQWNSDRSTGESAVSVARRWLLEAAGAPVVASRRVVLIEHADAANEHIQNALLKSLEEPTLRHAFILVADDASRLLPTIRSRCQPIRIGPVRAGRVSSPTSWRRDSSPRTRRGRWCASRTASPVLPSATRTHAELIDWRRRTQVELLALLERGPADRFGAVGDLLDEAARVAPTEPAATPLDGDAEEAARTTAAVQRGAAGRVVEVWTDLARDLLVAGAGRGDLAPSGELGDLDALARRIPPAELTAMITLLERIAEGLRDYAAPRLAIERAMLAWPRLERSPTVGDGAP